MLCRKANTYRNRVWSPEFAFHFVPLTSDGSFCSHRVHVFELLISLH